MAADWLNPRAKGKEKSTDEKEELFVFGYACKLFRDDERALSIDKGSHLIPWMGDDKLLIDRYDGRGHLYDLKPYDSSHAQPCELTAEEEKLEELCNEERYLELHTDVAEKKLYEEEEWKRYYQSLSEGYGAVGFSYDYHSHLHKSEYYQANAEEEKPFEVPPELSLPEDIAPPDTEKSNAIIEKTAKFVAKQGAQMEILIKTKQANNPQFEFLHFENPLNPYYKHMVKMIKSGKYKPKEEAAEEEDPDDDEDEGPGYLHPSLMVTRKASPAPEVPAYKPLEMPKISVHDTPYGQLIKTLAKKQQPDAAEDVNQVSDYQDEVKPLKPPPLPPFYQDAGYSGNHHTHPPPPGIEPVTLPSCLQTEPPPPGTDVEGQMLPHRQTQLVMDDYQTEAQSRASPGPFDHIVPPPPDIQPVIDRMAMYVAKNGIEFEIVVKSKNDPRFQFLLPHHVHFPYYDFKKQIHMREAAKERERDKRDVEKPTSKLSFSIKPKEENKRKEKKKKKVFDNESSENDADSDREKSSASGTSTPVGSDYTEEKTEKPMVPQEERDRKMAEDRLRDKLAHAAREKLAQTSREKQMQAERKRKAAMFINMLRSCNPGAAGDEEKLEEEFLNAKDSEKSTPVPTPGCSPYYGPLEKDKCEDVSAKKPKKSKHKDRSKRSRSRSPRRRRRRSRSTSPARKLNRSHSPRRSRSPSRRRSRSPSSRRRSRSPSHRGSGRDRHSSSKKSKKRRRSRTSSRSPKPNPEQPVSIDLTVDDSPERPSLMNGDESSYSLSQYNIEQSQRMYDQREPSSDRLTPSLEADDSNSNASDSRSVSSYMRERVRAIIKASRKAIMEEEGSLYDDT